MASSEVDQKFLGQFAKTINDDNPYLSSMLYKVLGLSVILSKKLVKARKFRKLDTTRDTKSLQLYHHIIWMSREGLVIVEQYVLPMVANYHNELKVLSYKLRASFYHIFVLFHNYPPATQAAVPGLPRPQTIFEDKDNKDGGGSSSPSQQLLNGGPVGGTSTKPPGLTTLPMPKPTSSFLLPAINYIPLASACFSEAAQMADQLLPGSHPIRLSVKLEWAAFMYDCLKDAEASRRLAKHAIADVYNAKEGMNDEMFEDAAELVGILGRMMKRGQHQGSNVTSTSTGTVGTGGSSSGNGNTPGSGSGSKGKTPRLSGDGFVGVDGGEGQIHPYTTNRDMELPRPSQGMTNVI
ncbi:MAG: hypothetical protein M1816_005049 [Peltula sp. TS41687]|nr:MAG: hypothetical protein M1816_005049 [Peltula sp. TS41687]